MSVRRIVSCPFTTWHPLVEPLCTDGGDSVNGRDPIPYISQDLSWADIAGLWIVFLSIE